jgi:hypothetical protein
MIDEQNEVMPEPMGITEQPNEPVVVKNKGGRPKGSKNKKKARGRGRKKVVKKVAGHIEMEETPREPRRRRRRTNIGEPNYSLAAPQIPGYETRWVNDYEGKDRLNMFYQNDWDFVEPREVKSWMRIEVGDETVTPQLQLGNKVARKVGTNQTGTVLYAYLMKKRKEHYEADYQEQQKLGPGKKEEQLKGGNTGVPVEYQHGNITFNRD